MKIDNDHEQNMKIEWNEMNMKWHVNDTNEWNEMKLLEMNWTELNCNEMKQNKMNWTKNIYIFFG